MVDIYIYIYILPGLRQNAFLFFLSFFLTNVTNIRFFSLQVSDAGWMGFQRYDGFETLFFLSFFLTNVYTDICN